MPAWWPLMDSLLTIATVVMLAIGLRLVIQINRRNRQKDREL